MSVQKGRPRHGADSLNISSFQQEVGLENYQQKKQIGMKPQEIEIH
jgi:hypothetical protein